VTHAPRASGSQRVCEPVAGGAARGLARPSPCPRHFVPSVTAPLYSAAVFLALRYALRKWSCSQNRRTYDVANRPLMDCLLASKHWPGLTSNFASKLALVGSQRSIFVHSPSDQIGLSVKPRMLETHAMSSPSARHRHGSQPLGKGWTDQASLRSGQKDAVSHRVTHRRGDD
jgi:hypothetical protein